MSPGYPANYPEGKTCERVVRFEEKSSIRIEFLGEFELEMFKKGCFDFVEIRSGDDENSPLIMKVCGNTKPQVIVLSGNSAWIKFFSDRFTNKKGFYLLVTQVKNGECK